MNKYFPVTDYEGKSTRREKSGETRCSNSSQERANKHNFARFMPVRGFCTKTDQPTEKGVSLYVFI